MLHAKNGANEFNREPGLLISSIDNEDGARGPTVVGYRHGEDTPWLIVALIFVEHQNRLGVIEGDGHRTDRSILITTYLHVASIPGLKLETELNILTLWVLGEGDICAVLEPIHALEVFVYYLIGTALGWAKRQAASVALTEVVLCAIGIETVKTVLIVGDGLGEL